MGKQAPVPLSVKNTSELDKTNLVIAALVFIFTSVVYLLTVAPTFSFWDCGEFVACAHTLGIPHPPGATIYLLLGRLLSVLPLGDDISWRVNLLSVFSSSLSATVGYLIVQRSLVSWAAGVPALWRRNVSYVGAVVGAGMLAFGRTSWANAVEAEVYGLAMLFFLLCLWLALLAWQSASPARRTAYGLLGFYLMTLGAGVHMTVLLVAPALIAVLALKREATDGAGGADKAGRSGRDWTLVTALMGSQLFLIFALSSKPGEVPFYLPLLVVGVIWFFHVFSLARTPRPLVLLGVVFVLGIYPLYFNLVEIVAGDLSPTMRSLESLPVQWLGYAVALLAIVWSVLQGYRQRKLSSKEREGAEVVWKTVLGYALVSVVAVLLTEYVSGYQVFMILSALLLVAIAVALRKRLNWQVLLAGVAVSTAVIGFWTFTHFALATIVIVTLYDKLVYSAPAGSAKKAVIVFCGVGVLALALWYSGFQGQEPLTLAGFLAVAAVIALWRRSYRGSPNWRVAVGAVVLAVLAFSTHTFVPIRSAQSPYIDQNNPSRSMAAFVGFVERKQYGSQSMIERIFKRRAEWSNQFGMHRRMGFWGFFRQQFGFPGAKFAIPLVLGILGLWEMMRRRRAEGGMMLSALLLATAGLIFYMNFADGTRMIGGRDYLEVRDRDYFFTPGFMLFGLAVGLGVGAVLTIIYESLSRASRSLRLTIAMSLGAFSLTLPAVTLAKNYQSVDQSGNYIPYDYAYNLLSSAVPGAIFITAGDNDTFPLWAMQAVYNYRRDVTVMNLSLSNTDWYLKLLRDRYDVPLPLSDKQINSLRPVRSTSGRLIRIQDQIVDFLITTMARHQRPIQFSVTTPSSSRKYQGLPLSKRLSLTGRSYLVRSDTSGFRLDMSRTDSLHFDVFQYRGMGREGVHQSSVTYGLTYGYSSLFLQMADTLEATGDWEGALRQYQKLNEILPDHRPGVQRLIATLVKLGYSGRIAPLIERSKPGDRLSFYKHWARQARVARRNLEAIEALSLAADSYPADKQTLFGLVALQLEERRYTDARRRLLTWVVLHPDDSSAVSLLQGLGGAGQPLK